MEPRRARGKRKGANLNELGRDSHVSQSGIVKLLDAVTRDGIPEHYSRKTQYRERKRFAASTTPHGKLIMHDTLHLKDGTHETIGVQNPMAALYKSWTDCEGYRAMMQGAIAEYGMDRSWRLILYNDGITPQDSASSHDQRKLVSVYWAFREFGDHALMAEESWGICATVRQTVLNKYEGGLSRFISHLLKRYFFNSAGGTADLDAGVQMPDGSVLKATLWCFVADEPALKDFFLCKGHAGLLPCILCRNVILQRLFDPMAHRHPFVTTACTNWDDLRPHTDASIRGVFMHLADAHTRGVRGPEFDELELTTGLNYNVFSLVAEPHVNVASQLMFDWPHCYCIGGLVDVEIGQCMAALMAARAPTTYIVLGGFLKQWTWPRRLSPPIEKLFDAKAVDSHRKAASFKSTASELMTLSAAISFYMVNVALRHGAATPQVRSLIAAIDTLELLMMVRKGCVEPHDLRASIEQHLKLYKEAYGEDSFRPKHHYAYHLWRMLEHFGILISCLHLERLHKIPKRYVANRRNTTSYELGTIEDSTLKQFWDRKQLWYKVGSLVDAVSPKTLIAEALREMYPAESDPKVATYLYTSAGPAHMDDVVLYEQRGEQCCGQVKLHCHVHGETVTFVENWERVPVADLGSMAARYKVVTNACPVPSASIKTSVCYSVSADGFATVLIPPLYRQ